MHIEIGIISPEKLAYAGVAATALLGAHTMGLLKSPTAWLRTALDQNPRDPGILTLMGEAHERDGSRELAGERSNLGLLLHDPEEEQDCFSDNTANSHYHDVLGMVGEQEVRSLFDGVLQSFISVDGERLTAHQPVAWLRTT